MAFLNKNKSAEKEKVIVALMVQNLEKIYSNKSGDEYKMHGDITLSPVYNLLQRTIADLPLIKGISKIETSDIKIMFNMLHRPNFKKIVSNYIATKNEDCIMMTATFTVAYRVLIGELSRIYSSTEATEKGFVYKSTKYSRENNMSRFIRNFNHSIDAELTKSVRATTKGVKAGSKFKMESYYQEGGLTTAAQFAAFVNDALGPISNVFREIGAWCRLLFPDVTALNPVSWMSNILSNNYDRKVNRYQQLALTYVETKKAYDEYMKLPEFQRSKKVESKYIKNINKYNIRMQNAQAAIAHYDQRAMKETMEEARRAEEYAKKSESKASKSTEEKPAKTEGKESTESKSTSSSTSNDDDPFDF